MYITYKNHKGTQPVWKEKTKQKKELQKESEKKINEKIFNYYVNINFSNFDN